MTLKLHTSYMQGAVGDFFGQIMTAFEINPHLQFASGELSRLVSDSVFHRFCLLNATYAGNITLRFDIKTISTIESQMYGYIDPAYTVTEDTDQAQMKRVIFINRSGSDKLFRVREDGGSVFTSAPYARANNDKHEIQRDTEYRYYLKDVLKYTSVNVIDKTFFIGGSMRTDQNDAVYDEFFVSSL